MTHALQTALGRATRSIMWPLARILIRNGVAFATVVEWARKVYVDVAFADFCEAGKKQTVSRVSALTGISRKEVKRLRELSDGDGLNAGDRYNRAIRVISGWVNDENYHDDAGEPAVLQTDGSEGSFAALVRDYSGDIPMRAMLSVLQAAGSVVELADGRVRLVRHAYIPGNDPVDKLHILGTDVKELVETIDHNITTPDNVHFQRKVSNVAISPDAVGPFRDLSRQKSQALLEELDAWLETHSLTPEEQAAGQSGRYVSLGIFYSDNGTSQEDQQ